MVVGALNDRRRITAILKIDKTGPIEFLCEADIPWDDTRYLMMYTPGHLTCLFLTLRIDGEILSSVPHHAY